MITIAIDGPAGAGKSTIAKAVARDLGITYLDTGAMYRACALYALQQGVAAKDSAAVIPLLQKMQLDIRFTDEGQRIYLDGKDVSASIRQPEISIAASDISAIPEVRVQLVRMQRDLAGKQDTVLDGRDIGSYVLPQAKLKIFLTAGVEERARRRLLDLKSKGLEQSLADVQADIIYRDEQDSKRAFAPLTKTDDAVEIDSTHLSIEEVKDLVIGLAKERFALS